MPRLPDPSKRCNILEAAVAVMAEEGIAVPVSRIAQRAGVAQGSIFNHFPTKAELLNETYLHLTADLQSHFPEALPEDSEFEAALHTLWVRWMRWSASVPNKRLVLNRLSTSEHLTAETRAKAVEMEEPGSRFLRKAASLGTMHDEPEAFVFAIVCGIAIATMDYMRAHPAQADYFCEVGYQAFRRALS